ncbi:MAG: CoA-binding protein [Chloroflexota bacterium]
MEIKRRPSLAEVFSPRGVACVGVSPQPRSFVTRVMQGLIDAEFPAIYPVNPRYTEVLGRRCYPSLQAIDGVVDHVVVGIPAQFALSLLDDCAAKGVKSVHFFTAGFSETGDKERAQIEKTMLDKAKAGGFRIIGPNCVGFYVPKSRLANGTGLPKEPGPIAFMSQSGGHASNLPFYGEPAGLRFSKVVSYGNALDVNEGEYLEYLAQDPDTEIIGAYIEGVRDGRRFMKALEMAAARKPVVIYKGGVTEAGKRAAMGHTGSLTSSVAVFEALCRQKNAIRVDDLDELIDALVALRFVKPFPKGLGVAVVGAGGGPSVLASDEIERAGLQLPRLSSEVQGELKKFLPVDGSILANPVDTDRMVVPEPLADTLRILGKVPDIHMLIYHMGFHPISRWGDGRFSSPAFLDNVPRVLAEAQRESGKPVLVGLFPAPNQKGMEEYFIVQETFVKAGFPIFHSLRQLAKAMSRVIASKKA